MCSDMERRTEDRREKEENGRKFKSRRKGGVGERRRTEA